MGIFVAYPFGSILYHAFTRWDGIAPAQWVGLAQLPDALARPDLPHALRNNAIFALSVPIQMVLPLLVAYAIHRRVPGWRLFRATVFLPAVYATVVIGILTATVLQLERPAELGARRRRPRRAASTSGWRSASTSIPLILLDRGLDELRLQRPALPRRHERDRPVARGGRTDRRGRLAAHPRFVIVPNLRRVMEIVLVVNTITAFAFMFTYIYTITNGGPGNDTYVSEFYIYQQAFTNQNMGYAAAIGVMLV